MTDDEIVQFVLDNADNLTKVVQRLKPYAFNPENAAEREREYQRTHVHARRVRRNDESREKAARHRSEWTGPELELADREDLTAAQVAAMTGRTIKAVKTIRTKLRRDVRLQELRGMR